MSTSKSWQELFFFCGEASAAVCSLRPNSSDGTHRLFACTFPVLTGQSVPKSSVNTVGVMSALDPKADIELISSSRAASRVFYRCVPDRGKYKRQLDTACCHYLCCGVMDIGKSRHLGSSMDDSHDRPILLIDNCIGLSLFQKLFIYWRPKFYTCSSCLEYRTMLFPSSVRASIT